MLQYFYNCVVYSIFNTSKRYKPLNYNYEKIAGVFH